MKKRINMMVIGLALIVLGSVGCHKRGGDECSPDCQEGLACYEGECYYPCDWDYQCPSQQPFCELIGDDETAGHDGICVGEGDIPCVPTGDEVCDGRDNDCDGLTDEDGVCVEVQTPCDLDEVRDCPINQPGICGVGETHCLNDGSGFGPCEPLHFGDEPEICGDRIDNNCDGTPDENCLCEPDEVVACLTGEPGVCRDGTAACLPDSSGFGFCTPVTGASEEICDGRDNDCDGEADEGCECMPAEMRPCGMSMGECTVGVEACDENGRWDMSTCTGTQPASEICDGLDNDCDASIDEDCECASGASRPCGTDMGECTTGTQTCADGFWGLCSGTAPQSELCDTLDNDCDGDVDENCDCVDLDTQNCESDVGECVHGTQTCSGGRWGECLGYVGSQPEICGNLLDENCNGYADEDCICTPGATRICGTDVGICTSGLETCTAGRYWGVCVGATYGDSESCDTLDNDCDGDIDEGCSCVNGTTQPCGTDLGECSRGTQTCVMGRWGVCTGEVRPVSETCDGLDNDCDGAIDDGCTCTIGESRSCGTDMGECVAGTQTCLNNGFGMGYWGDCGGTYVGPQPEICGDGLDNNCNSYIDESCGGGGGGVPFLEICGNGVDDDGDTVVDDGCSGPGRYQHCWTLPGVAPRVAFEGCVGWSISTGPGDGLNGRLVCTAPWQLLVETANASSFCLTVALEPGLIIEYNSVSDLVPNYWGCVGPYPPGTLNGSHSATLGGAPVAYNLVDNRLGGCNFRYQRP